MALNRYCGVIHTGANNGYRIDPGHVFVNQPVVTDPLSFPGADKQVVGHPFIITETAWVHPARYQSAGPFLAAAYNSLTGVDTFFWFAAGVPTWNLDLRRKFWPVLRDNPTATPSPSGPAACRRTWACGRPTRWPSARVTWRPAKAPAVHEERTLENMWERTVPIISEAGKYDPNRDQGQFAPASSIKQQVDPLAFLVGPVEVKYGGDPANNHVIDLKPYIDRSAGVVRSVTGQIALNYKNGVCTVDAPRYQGAAGFLKAGGGKYDLSRRLHHVEQRVRRRDRRAHGRRAAGDLARGAGAGGHRRAADQLARGAGDRQGEQAQDLAGYKIVTTGRPPLRVANTEVTLTITNASLTKATLLNPSGYAAKDVPVRRRRAAS